MGSEAPSLRSPLLATDEVALPIRGGHLRDRRTASTAQTQSQRVLVPVDTDVDRNMQHVPLASAVRHAEKQW